MNGEPESSILSHLRRLDTKIDALIEDVRDLKCRVMRLESRVTDLRDGLATFYGGRAGQSTRFDRIEAVLDRIEQRLGLAPLP